MVQSQPRQKLRETPLTEPTSRVCSAYISFQLDEGIGKRTKNFLGEWLKWKDLSLNLLYHKKKCYLV
jgi:hypothetical protein